MHQFKDKRVPKGVPPSVDRHLHDTVPIPLFWKISRKLSSHTYTHTHTCAHEHSGGRRHSSDDDVEGFSCFFASIRCDMCTESITSHFAGSIYTHCTWFFITVLQGNISSKYRSKIDSGRCCCCCWSLLLFVIYVWLRLGANLRVGRACAVGRESGLFESERFNKK